PRALPALRRHRRGPRPADRGPAVAEDRLVLGVLDALAQLVLAELAGGQRVELALADPDHERARGPGAGGESAAGQEIHHHHHELLRPQAVRRTLALEHLRDRGADL